MVDLRSRIAFAKGHVAGMLNFGLDGIVDGIVVGLTTGLVGAGGGFLIVPALALLGGLPMPVAVGTSLVVIAMKSFAGPTTPHPAGHQATPVDRSRAGHDRGHRGHARESQTGAPAAPTAGARLRHAALTDRRAWRVSGARRDRGRCGDPAPSRRS